jgi:hypothetical protein
MVVTKICSSTVGTCERSSSILVELEGTMVSALKLRILLWLDPGALMDWVYGGGDSNGDGKASC